MPVGKLRKLIVAIYQRDSKALVAWIPVCLIILFIGVIFIGMYVDDYQKRYQFNHLPVSEHLRLARSACWGSWKTHTAQCLDPVEARRHLDKIPPSAPEFREAEDILNFVQHQEQVDQRQRSAAQEWDQRLKAAEEQEAIRRRTVSNDTAEQSREQMLKNTLGQAHDSFTCRVSPDKKTLVSFDYGHFWWEDDGHCVVWAKRKAEGEQRQRDADAYMSSYWPTTMRVDTDIDAFWLPDEERTCKTYPDETGKVSAVACKEGETHFDHNIPVKFWGGLVRNAISEWKCRREKGLGDEEFVCRALN